MARLGVRDPGPGEPTRSPIPFAGRWLGTAKARRKAAVNHRLMEL